MFRVGTIDTSYARLVKIFGRPLKGDGYKTDAEWLIRFSDGTIATVYNYKTGRAYLGAAGKPVEEITRWNIGGHSARAAHLVTATVRS